MISDEQQKQITDLTSFRGCDPADLELAREIARQVVELYGDMQADEWEKFYRDGIWNDHAAVQSALVAIRLIKAAPSAPTEAVEGVIEALQRVGKYTGRSHMNQPLSFSDRKVVAEALANLNAAMGEKP